MGHLDANIGRREKSRLRVGLGARLDLVGGAQNCILNDISKTGARIGMQEPPRPGECGVLLFSNIEAFGTIVWRNKSGCGLRFDTELSDGELLDLRQTGDNSAEVEKYEAVDFARKWVQGY